MTDFQGQLSTFDLVLLFVVVLLPVVCNLAYTIYRHITKKETGRHKAVNTIPVALSLTASYLSANTIMGVPAIMINQGLTYWCLILAFPLSMAIVAHLIVPVTYNADRSDIMINQPETEQMTGLKNIGKRSSIQHAPPADHTDIFMYLEKRFSSWFRLIGAGIFCILQMVYLSIVLHGPAILFRLISKQEATISIIAIGLICSLYTALGGLKANTYIEAFQLITMLIGLLAIVISTYSTSNIVHVFYNATVNDTATSMFSEGTNYSVMSTIVGGTVLYAAIYAVNQSQVQRYFSCSSMKKAQWSLWLNSPGLIIIVSLCCLFGAFLKAEVPKTYEQIDEAVGIFLVEKVQVGVAGLFIAGVFNATMSSISCGLSATNNALFRNFLPKCIKRSQHSEVISSALAFFIGIFCIVLAVLIRNEQGILKASFSFYGIFCCPMFGVLVLGIFFPFVHEWGALLSLVVTIPFLLSLYIGNLKIAHLSESLQKLYSINFFWYGPIGVSMVLVIGTISSKIIPAGSAHRFQDPSSDLSRKLISPITRKIMKRFMRNNKPDDQTELDMMNDYSHHI